MMIRDVGIAMANVWEQVVTSGKLLTDYKW